MASEIHCPCNDTGDTIFTDFGKKKKITVTVALVFLEAFTNKGASQRLLGRGICRGLGLSQSQLLKSELLPRELGLG